LSKYGCEGELVKIDCDNSRVIQIVRANYGRLASNVCTTSQTSSSSSSLGECLHRSSKSVLDRVCGGRSSCTVRASEDLFQGDCPLVEKYLEVHFRCVSVKGEGGARRDLIPPWLEDLSATFRPVTRVVTTTSTTFTASTTPITHSTTPSTTSTTSDNIRADEDHQNIVSSEGPVTAGGQKGRYFLIAEADQEIEGEEEPSSTTLIITVTISTVTTILSILIMIQLCRKFRGKGPPREEQAEESCYQCQTEVRTTDLIPVIPVQNILYSPVSASEPTEYHKYRSLPFHINKLDNGLRRSTTEDSAIYGYQNKPDDNDGVYQTNNEPEGIYHIPFIDSNNYMRTNILHTQLYGDRGDIKIMSQSKSFHPVESIPTVTTNNISLPDLSEATSSRRPANSEQKIQRMMTLRRPEELERMSPIQILFNDSGQYFVNFNLDPENK